MLRYFKFIGAFIVFGGSLVISVTSSAKEREFGGSLSESGALSIGTHCAGLFSGYRTSTLTLEGLDQQIEAVFLVLEIHIAAGLKATPTTVSLHPTFEILRQLEEVGTFDAFSGKLDLNQLRTAGGAARGIGELGGQAALAIARNPDFADVLIDVAEACSMTIVEAEVIYPAGYPFSTPVE